MGPFAGHYQNNTDLFLLSYYGDSTSLTPLNNQSVYSHVLLTGNTLYVSR